MTEGRGFAVSHRSTTGHVHLQGLDRAVDGRPPVAVTANTFVIRREHVAPFARVLAGIAGLRVEDQHALPAFCLCADRGVNCHTGAVDAERWAASALQDRAALAAEWNAMVDEDQARHAPRSGA